MGKKIEGEEIRGLCLACQFLLFDKARKRKVYGFLNISEHFLLWSPVMERSFLLLSFLGIVYYFNIEIVINYFTQCNCIFRAEFSEKLKFFLLIYFSEYTTWMHFNRKVKSVFIVESLEKLVV